MVNCELYQSLKQSPIVAIDKIDTAAGGFLHRLDKNYISDVIFEVCEGAYNGFLFLFKKRSKVTLK